MSRGQAYEWLQEKTGIAKEDCHIGHMDYRQCQLVINAAYDFFKGTM